MTRTSRWLRRAEIILWVTGISLLAVAAASTSGRWNHQRQQERALLQRGSADPVVRPRAAAPSTAPLSTPDALLRSTGPRVGPEIPRSLFDRRAEGVATSPKLSAERSRPAREPAESPSAFGRIEIPRLELGVVVEEGADEKTLARAVGLVPGSARPGETGNVVLAGHRDTFFRPLRKIELSDRIRVVVPPDVYEYEVQSIRVVEPHETDVLQSKGVEELTLVTCYPFRFIGPAPERFIVSAARVN